MSQVLEKPILLDETGQEIAGKLDTNSAAIVDALDDIKDAIGTSSEFIPVMIKVVTPPTKISYKAGEALDLTGIVVNLVGTNGVQIDVTQACTFSPANGTTITSGMTNVAISYHYAADNLDFSTSQAISITTLSSITATTPPTNTDYSVGDALDLTGIVVTATYSDGTTAIVTNDCTFSPADGTTLTSNDTTITITYIEGGVTKTTTQTIIIKELVSIAITTPPTQTEYAVGEALDLTGIVVTATYDDASTLVVTSNCTFSPVDGTYLTASDTSVTVSYTKGSVTKTATQTLEINAIYGAEWDGTATSAWTRTDAAADFTDPDPYYAGRSGTSSSPFDNIYPWSEMQIVDTVEAGKLVSIPKFYYKLTQSGNAIKIQICKTQAAGFHISPAHMDKGDYIGERDVVYVGRYHNNTSYKSVTGATPVNTAYSNCYNTVVTNVHNNGNDIWEIDLAMMFTIWMLYLVEYADWNSQEKIGYGRGDRSATTTGYTDSMPYHTGTTQSSRTTYGYGTQYRYIEGIWDNTCDLLAGIYQYDSHMFVLLKPSVESYMNIYTNGREFTSIKMMDGIPTNMKVVEDQYLFPFFWSDGNGSGSETTYLCDYWQGMNSDDKIFWGSFSNKYPDQVSGMFYVRSDNYRSTDSSTLRGSRLMKLPNS